jgi:thiol:disulfide interchange protein/DsbC/DsbD-like thiol-disulfide interchange protein
VKSTQWIAALTLAAALIPPAFAAGAKSVVTTDRVRAELVANAPDGVAAGKPVWVGLQLAHQPGWHTYWKNSGDSGLPTQLQWTLPQGVTAGDIAWPVPKKIPVGSLANYGYDGTVLLPVPLTIAPDFKPSLLGRSLEVKLHANWLVCKKECIPEEGDFTLDVPATSSTALNSGAFEAAFKAQPKALAGESRIDIAGDSIKVTVAGLPASLEGKTLAFFPETPEVIETAAPFKQSWQGSTWTATVPLSLQRSQSPSPMPLVLALGDEGWRMEAKVTGTWPVVAGVPANVSPALESALRSNAAAPSRTASITLTAALLGALLGGIILNLMPCVFPVLAIKVMGFARHAQDVRAHRIAGLAYSGGVVLSFALLGAAMLAPRAAGEQLGWGFQLQSPGVVASLAALFTLIGLNLAGVFEFGSFLPSRVAALEARHPVVNSFLSGVLAVAIASPCTAPFMGASIGFAIGVPPAQAMLVFIALGVGMAMPYLAIAWAPAMGRVLPRPGAWMDALRKFMAFPMFATVAWLVWVVGQQSGIDGAGALLAMLVALSMVVWAFTLRGRARVLATAISIAFFAAVTWMAGGNITKPPAEQQSAAASADGWQRWEPGRVDQVLASGQPVFVDFTAAWCVTCQYNKKTTLSRPDVMAALANKNVALLRADWTRRDPAITAALAQLGREGVPVYVFYSAGKLPVVLSEVLDAQEVKDAISKL